MKAREEFPPDEFADEDFADDEVVDDALVDDFDDLDDTDWEALYPGRERLLRAFRRSKQWEKREKSKRKREE